MAGGVGAHPLPSTRARGHGDPDRRGLCPHKVAMGVLVAVLKNDFAGRVPRLTAAPLIVLVALGAACNDRAPDSPPSSAPPGSAQILTCDANVQAQTVVCSSAAPALSRQVQPGVRADLMLGGQGLYVTLRSSG